MKHKTKKFNLQDLSTSTLLTPTPSTNQITSYQNDKFTKSQKPHKTNYPTDDALEGTKRLSGCLMTYHKHRQQNLTIVFKITQEAHSRIQLIRLSLRFTIAISETKSD